MQVVGAWLRSWRLSTGATQRRLAQLSGVNQAHICRIEQGKRRPSGVPLARIIIALDWLSGGGDRAGPWALVGTPPHGFAARWDHARPPAVIGREPLPPPHQPWDEELLRAVASDPSEPEVDPHPADAAIVITGVDPWTLAGSGSRPGQVRWRPSGGQDEPDRVRRTPMSGASPPMPR
jgi:DNA-binding XRE family transcriptional regulator